MLSNFCICSRTFESPYLVNSINAFPNNMEIFHIYLPILVSVLLIDSITNIGEICRPFKWTEIGCPANLFIPLISPNSNLTFIPVYTQAKNVEHLKGFFYQYVG